MGRGFNALALATGTTMVLAASPGPAAAETAPGGVPVTVDPAVECADLATAPQPEGVIGTNFALASSAGQQLLTVERQSTWDGPLSTADGTACLGRAGLKSTLVLKGPGVSQLIKHSRLRMGVDAQTDQNEAPHAGVTSGVSYNRACAIAEARLQAGRRAALKLLERDDRTYEEDGFAARTRTFDMLTVIHCPPPEDIRHPSPGGVNAHPEGGVSSSR